MKFNFLIYSYLLFVLTFFSCASSTKITSEPEQGFGLSRYQTFAFMESDFSGDGPGRSYQPQVDYLQEEIAKQLTSRGLRPGKSSEADLLINLGIVVEEEVQTRETSIVTDPPRYIGQRRYTWQSREVEVGRYNVGTVSVHLIDRERNAMVWHGTAERILSDKPEKLREQIAKGIEKLVGSIPG